MLRNPLRQFVDRTVIVNLRDGSERSFRGTMEIADRQCIVLRDVVLVEPQQVPLGGQVVIATGNVAWVQVM